MYSNASPLSFPPFLSLQSPWLPYAKLGIVELEPPSQGGLCGFVNSGGASNIWSTTLDCGSRGAGTIDSIVFADYGQPTGYCNSLTAGKCTKDVRTAVAAACVGKAACTLLSSDATFGTSPCSSNRLAVEVTCSNKALNKFTYYDFEKADEGMIDFLTAADSSNRTTIPNFSTIPNWLFLENQGDRSYFPDDPLGETWSYERGSTFRDSTLGEIGDYYGRLLAHYVEPGGFIDEAGNSVAGVVGGPFRISTWEILNEIEGEHHLSPQLYTRVYDAVVAGIKRWAPTGSKGMKFMGLALENSGGVDYMTYFLNASNHIAGTPIDFVSFHHYAGASERDGGVNASDYTSFFSAADSWLNQLAAIQSIRDTLNPTVLLDADEVGVILPDDNDAKYTADVPGFPAIYWNAAGAMFAYLYGTTAVMGLDVLGESQLIGYPSIPFPRGPPINGNWSAPPQFPSVSLLSWGGAFGNEGDGTARYWTLKLLVDSFAPGPPAGSSLTPDVIVNTSVTTSGGGPVSSPFCAQVINLDNIEFYCATGVINAITFASYGTPTGSCGSWAVDPTCNAANTTSIVESLCLNKNSCSFAASTQRFGDPCYNTVKYLKIEATCSTGGGAQGGGGSPIYAQAFTQAGGGGKKVLVVNKTPFAQIVTLTGAATANAKWTYIDESTGYGPALQTSITQDTWTLAPYAWGIAMI